MITIRPIRVPELPAVVEAAKADGHEVPMPTHKVVKDGKIVGAMSIGVLPTVAIWFSPSMDIRDSITAETFVEAHVASTGAPMVVVPCQPDSPLFPYLQRIGFVNRGQFALFTKEL